MTKLTSKLTVSRLALASACLLYLAGCTVVYLPVADKCARPLQGRL